LEELTQTHDVRVRWHAFELRPAGGPPVSAEYRHYIETEARPRFVTMMRDQYGITINNGPFGINSRPALIGAKFAEKHGQATAYHDAVFRAYWQEARNIEDADVLTDVAVGVGLDEEGFRAALADPAGEAQIDADIATAQRSGLSAVPALVLNMKYLLSGAQPLPVLQRAVEQVSAESVPPPPQP
jgi:predicted DsbA family dithiol-disulfide isomerase